ncbi:MAG: hypothetical protein ABI251_02875 [Mycobacteriaceae bacterium]
MELGLRFCILAVDLVGLVLRTPNRLAAPLFGNLGDQRRQRQSPLACLGGEEIARRAGYADRARLGRHVAMIQRYGTALQ